MIIVEMVKESGGSSGIYVKVSRKQTIFPVNTNRPSSPLIYMYIYSTAGICISWSCIGKGSSTHSSIRKNALDLLKTFRASTISMNLSCTKGCCGELCSYGLSCSYVCKCIVILKQSRPTYVRLHYC